MSLLTLKRNFRKRAFASTLLFATTALTSASAGIVIKWDGTNTDYTNGASRTLAWSLNQASDNVWQRNYSGSTAITPASNYTGTPIYGAAWLSSSDGTVTSFNNQRLRSNYSSGGVTYKTQLEIGIKPSDTTPLSTGGALTFFKKEDFTGGAGTAAFGISETSSLSVMISLMNQATLRFAVLNDGRWYVSNDSFTNETGEPWTLNNTELYTSLWAEWDPEGGVDGRLADAPASFGISASTFQNIEAVGLLAEFGNTISNEYFYMSGFSADFQAIPEPGYVSVLLLGSPVYWLMRRRQMKSTTA